MILLTGPNIYNYYKLNSFLAYMLEFSVSLQFYNFLCGWTPKGLSPHTHIGYMDSDGFTQCDGKFFILMKKCIVGLLKITTRQNPSKVSFINSKNELLVYRSLTCYWVMVLFVVLHV